MKLGAQLFNLRDYCKTLDGLRESIMRVADMGYDTVQLSGVCAYEPEWVKEVLDEAGVTCSLTHTSYDRIKAEPEAVMREQVWRLRK